MLQLDTMYFKETNVRELGDEDVDMSGGCSHIREIADETGDDWETCHTRRTLSTINGVDDVEVYHDENGSIFLCWNAWKKGVGGRSGPSREEAIRSFLRKYYPYPKKDVIKFTPECIDTTLPVVADSWEKLRASDVDRLYGCFAFETFESIEHFTEYVTSKRPDLYARFCEVRDYYVEDLGLEVSHG